MRYLIMKWHYDYDNEGTWFDHDDGEEQYELIEGEEHSYPHIDRKRFKILSVTKEGDSVTAELWVDYSHVIVKNDGKPAIGHVSYSYSAAGDSVHTSLDLEFFIK